MKNSRRHKKLKIRKKVHGNALKPRFTVYRSLTSLYAQLIDDEAGRTLCCAVVKGTKNKEGAKKLGEMIAAEAQKVKITKAVFDRNAYKYHGVVKCIADSAREKGLQF